MAIVPSTQNVTGHGITALEADKDKILDLFARIQRSIDSLAFPKLENNLIASKFEQKHKASLSSLAAEIENFVKGDYFVSIIGRFSSGKSTLINALLGVDILPAELGETTSVVTKIKYGPRQEICIRFKSGKCISIAFDKDELYQYVCKLEGKHYSEKIDEIIVFSPSEVLKNGITIIDTPGLGSAFALNNQIANRTLAKSSAIIVAIHEFGGQENLDLIKKIFKWNNNNYFPIIFAITKKDTITEEPTAINAVLLMIDQAKKELKPPADITTPPICIISSKYELLYKQFQSGMLSLEEITKKNVIMRLQSEKDALALHDESGFDYFCEILNQTVLQSNIRREQIKNLLLAVNATVSGLRHELHDYLHYLQDYKTVEELRKAHNNIIYAISEIEKQGNAAVSALRREVEKMSGAYKGDKLDALIDRIYCHMIDFNEGMSYEKLAYNKFKKPLQELEKISTKETKAFFHNFYQEMENLTSTTLEHLDAFIQKATEQELIRADAIDLRSCSHRMTERKKYDKIAV